MPKPVTLRDIQRRTLDLDAIDATTEDPESNSPEAVKQALDSLAEVMNQRTKGFSEALAASIPKIDTSWNAWLAANPISIPPDPGYAIQSLQAEFIRAQKAEQELIRGLLDQAIIQNEGIKQLLDDNERQQEKNKRLTIWLTIITILGTGPFITLLFALLHH